MKKNIKNNSAASMTILGIWIVLFILLIGVFIVDISKTSYMRTRYKTALQNSVQTALKEQNSIGGLKYSSFQKLVNEYATITNRGKQTNQSKENLAFTEVCGKKGKYPKFTVYYDTSRKYSGVKGVKKQFTWEGVSTPANISKREEILFDKEKFVVLDVLVEDVVDNYFIGIFQKGGCSVITSQASAIVSSAFDEEGTKNER